MEAVAAVYVEAVVGDVMATVGATLSVALLEPVTIREMVSPFAVKLTFAVDVRAAVGLKRTVTGWLAPTPTMLKGLPETMLNWPDVEALPESVPPAVFWTVNVRSTKLPMFTLPKLVVPVGLTAKSACAAALAGPRHELSVPLASTAVTAT
jgi:hypothetical protein